MVALFKSIGRHKEEMGVTDKGRAYVHLRRLRFFFLQASVVIWWLMSHAYHFTFTLKGRGHAIWSHLLYKTHPLWTLFTSEGKDKGVSGWWSGFSLIIVGWVWKSCLLTGFFWLHPSREGEGAPCYGMCGGEVDAQISLLVSTVDKHQWLFESRLLTGSWKVNCLYIRHFNFPKERRHLKFLRNQR